MNRTVPLLDALADALRREPGRPLLTYDDRATGERIELSVATFDNWVSKIANLLTDELMLDPGARATVALPTHWQSTVSIIAAWTAGLTVVGPEDATDIAVVGPNAAREPSSVAAEHVLACSLRPLGGRFLDPLPDRWLDFAVEVPPQPDLLLHPPTSTGSDPATAFGTSAVPHDELVARALSRAEQVGLGPGGRLATDANPTTSDGLLVALMAPILLGGSVVLVTGADDLVRERLVTQEMATCVHWESTEG